MPLGNCTQGSQLENHGCQCQCQCIHSALGAAQTLSPIEIIGQSVKGSVCGSSSALSGQLERAKETVSAHVYLDVLCSSDWVFDEHWGARVPSIAMRTGYVGSIVRVACYGVLCNWGRGRGPNMDSLHDHRSVTSNEETTVCSRTVLHT
jgi:hypothetical protein